MVRSQLDFVTIFKAKFTPKKILAAKKFGWFNSYQLFKFRQNNYSKVLSAN